MSKKQTLANILDRLLPNVILPSINGLFSKKLTVLAYHRISDIPLENYQFDYELVSADCENFEFQIKYLKKYFNPISMNQLCDYVQGRAELPDKPVLITFDDGFDDNYLNAFPILKKHAVPATIFISTDYIDTQEIIWFDKLAAVILNMQSCELFIEEFLMQYTLDDNKATRRDVIFNILTRIKRLSNSHRVQLLDRLFEMNKDLVAGLDKSQSRMMTWAQIIEMANNGISFGSHTKSHPILTMLDEHELVDELVESKKLIENKLNRKIDTISYPNGGTDDFNDNVIEQSRLAEYIVGFSYIGGVNDLPIVDKYTIKRLHIESYVNKSYFKALLCMPKVFNDC